MGTGSAAFCQPHGAQLPVPAHYGELNQAGTCDDHKDEGKTHWKNSQDGWDERFFPRVWLEGGMAQFSISFCCSPCSTASCRTTLCYGSVRRAAANSSLALQLSIFLTFVQIEPYFVSKLSSRVLHTSKVRGTILNTSVCADNPEMQTKPLAASTL